MIVSYERAAHYPRESEVIKIDLKFRFYFFFKVVVIVRNFKNFIEIICLLNLKFSNGVEFNYFLIKVLL